MFSWLPKRERWNAILVEAAFAWLVFFADPFGLTEQRLRALDNFFAHATQYLRMAPPPQVAVVLVDQKWLEDRSLDWPAPYDAVADLVTELSCAHVKGIFFDFVLTKRYSPGDQRLRDAVEHGANLKTCPDDQPPTQAKFYFGRLQGVHSDLDAFLASNGRLFPLAVGEEDGVYRAAARDEHPERPFDIKEATPAFGLVRALDLTAATGDPNAPCAAGDARAKCWTAPLSLIWPGGLDPDYGKVADLTKCRGERNWLELIWEMPWPWASDARYELCPPVLTLRASQLEGDLGDVEAKGDPAEFLKGRIVLVGADLPGLNDSVVSPIHNRLPGVYKHAVALGELIAYGASYPTYPSRETLMLIVAALFLVVETAREMLRKTKRELLPESRADRWAFASVVALAFAAFSGLIWLKSWPASLAIVVFLDYAFAVLALFVARRTAETADAQDEGHT